MPVELRDYQIRVKHEIYEAWESPDTRAVCAVKPCGGGKTKTMAAIARERDERGLIMAHRQELVSQISKALAEEGVFHRIVAPDEVIADIVKMHVEEIGRNYVRSDADYAVAGVDTLIRRQDPFFDKLAHWQTDEGHHLQASNKWGRAVGMLGPIRGIGWTATPRRADRRSLRRGAGGCYDTIVIGPTPRELINRGFLKDFMIYGLPQRIDLTRVHVSSSGDFNQHELADAAEEVKATITGDIVQTAIRVAPGKKGVTFAVNVAMAEEHAQGFRDAGIPCAVLEANTRNRTEIIRAYRGDGLQEVCNVDVLGEGFDLPGIARASFARPTASFPLFVQQFGRPLRPMPGEPFGIICDHVGNVIRHNGPPDGWIDWSLDGGAREREPGEEPMRVCTNPECARMWLGFSTRCPHCGTKPKPTPAERQRPDILEGDLTLYDAALLAHLRGQVARIRGEPEIPYGASPHVARKIERVWNERAAIGVALEAEIDQWAGYWHHIRGEPLDAVYRRFYATFGMDTQAALIQPATKQQAMLAQVAEHWRKRT